MLIVNKNHTLVPQQDTSYFSQKVKAAITYTAITTSIMAIASAILYGGNAGLIPLGSATALVMSFPSIIPITLLILSTTVAAISIIGLYVIKNSSHQTSPLSPKPVHVKSELADIKSTSEQPIKPQPVENAKPDLGPVKPTEPEKPCQTLSLVPQQISVKTPEEVTKKSVKSPKNADPESSPNEGCEQNKDPAIRTKYHAIESFEKALRKDNYESPGNSKASNENLIKNPNQDLNLNFEPSSTVSEPSIIYKNRQRIEIPIYTDSLLITRKMAETSHKIRKEFVETEKTFAEALNKSCNRIDALIMINKEGSLNRNELYEIRERLFPITVPLTSEYIEHTNNYINDIKNNLKKEKITNDELIIIKNYFSSAKQLATDMSAAIEDAKTNQEVANVYIQFFSGNSTYGNSVKNCALNYKKLVSVDEKGLGDYSTTFQRMPRHSLLLKELNKATPKNEPIDTDESPIEIAIRLVQDQNIKINNVLSG